ncbi:MAG: alpha/beta fold hydrolase [Solirubrobacteraceae bacterium]
MPEAKVNGVKLYHQLHGEGHPLALVHGSWGDATNWQFVLPRLAESFRVLVYDRRGHSRSERPEGQGSVHEDGDDLAALLESLELAPAHVVANSFGSNIALRLAAKRPQLFRSLSCHEPPLWQLLADDPQGREVRQRQARTEEAVGTRIAAGDHEGAARQFVDELAFGPGIWDNQLPPEVRAMFVRNAPTFLDELQDPDVCGADLTALARLPVPLRLTQGTESLAHFARAIDRLVEAAPQIKRETIPGAGHVPQLTVPELYAETIASFVREAEALAPGRV